MYSHVLLNLLNKVEKGDKMRGWLSILSFFRNDFNKFYYKGARMLDIIYHMTLKLIKNRIFGVKASIVCNLFTQFYNRRIYVTLWNL